jgi:hypothetical protein
MAKLLNRCAPKCLGFYTEREIWNKDLFDIVEPEYTLKANLRIRSRETLTIPDGVVFVLRNDVMIGVRKGGTLDLNKGARINMYDNSAIKLDREGKMNVNGIINIGVPFDTGDPIRKGRCCILERTGSIMNVGIDGKINCKLGGSPCTGPSRRCWFC